MNDHDSIGVHPGEQRARAREALALTWPDCRFTQRNMAFHGLAVMLVGLIGGFAWAFSLTGIDLGPITGGPPISIPGDPGRWRAVHTGCVLNGIMALLFAVILPLFSLSAAARRRSIWAVRLTVWGNAVFYLTAVAAPNRALTLGSNQLGPGNIWGAIGFVAAMIAAIALIALTLGLLRALITGHLTAPD
jgi:hypothetical protein